MGRVISAGALLLASTTLATAGGIDRSGQSVGIIFEEGTRLEFSIGSVSPSVSGTAVAGLGGFDSGDMAESYTQLGFGFKQDIGNGFSGAVIYDQPFGADVNYPTGTRYYGGGAIAELNTHAITGILKYTNANNISVFGGIRYQTIDAEAEVPFVGGYSVTSDSDSGVGYLVGAAYERPDIALRIALTYNSKIEHQLSSTETGGILGAGFATTDTEIVTPQSLNLEFQSGVAEDTLVFGSVRWVEWSEFEIAPTTYVATAGQPLVSYSDDRINYSIGVGRRLNDMWAVAASVGYEKTIGGISSNLGPTDGNTSLGLGATYTMDNMEITAGIRHIWIGDAETEVSVFSPAASFEDNTATAFGLQVAYTF